MPQPLAHLSAIALAAFAAALATSPAIGADATPAMKVTSVAPVAEAGVSRTVRVGLNKSVVVDLPRDARDIILSNPDVAEAVIRTPTRIYITGIKVGTSNVIVFDRAGQQIVTLQLNVQRDTAPLVDLLHRLLPDANIDVEVLADSVVLSGSVKNASESQRAQDVANVFISNAAAVSGSADPQAAAASGAQQTASATVVNLLTIQGEDQVQVKVKVVEVQRNVIKQLGLNLSASDLTFGALSFSGSTGLPYSVNNGAVAPIKLGLSSSSGGSVSAELAALEQTGMFKVLAEPTLSAISGESASFLAGGEFPVPTGKDQSGNVTIEFKPYGVALSMTPIVLSDGRISLHVRTEVSELSSTQTLTLSGTTIPGLNVRRAETTLELPSGGAMVIGGLLQDSDRQAVARIPGLGSLPVLGQLFRSRDFQRNETELVIIVTPYLVKPVANTALTTPDQGLATPADSQTLLFGNLNRLYGGAAAAPTPAGAKYKGSVGYIYQ